MPQFDVLAIRRQLAARVTRQLRLLDELPQPTSSDPEFLVWRKNTTLLLRELGDRSPYLRDFDQLSFRSYPQQVAKRTSFPEGQLLHQSRFASDYLVAKELLGKLARALQERPF
jgi:hypothetical protein